MAQTLGIYVSVPFCRAKCTYCNFASGAFGEARMDAYVERLCAEIRAAQATAERTGAPLPQSADTVYFGGGTPSLLSPHHFQRIFAALHATFSISPEAEFTLECPPGQLAASTLDALLSLGLSRVSLGIQSFNDVESRAVGRFHTRQVCLAEVDRLRAAGVPNLNLDLIAGLPHQTAASWRESVSTALETGVPHLSLYMLEVDEDSNLGSEVLAHGGRYGAATVPSDDETAAWYSDACEWLAQAGVAQYEISNFARPGFASRHNLKYWTRDPYLGFGLDAHSMLRNGVTGIRWANTDSLDHYLAHASQQGREFDTDSTLPLLPSPAQLPELTHICPEQAFEEALFLGLRRNAGVELAKLQAEFSPALVRDALAAADDAIQGGLLELTGGSLRLTSAGRMVSNEVFARLLLEPAA